MPRPSVPTNSPDWLKSFRTLVKWAKCVWMSLSDQDLYASTPSFVLVISKMYFIYFAPLVSAPILLRLCKRVGARATFSTSRITEKKLLGMSKCGLVDRQEYRGAEMATDAVVMEPAGE